MVSGESAVVENASFLFQLLYIPYEILHWRYISKFIQLRMVVVYRRDSSCEDIRFMQNCRYSWGVAGYGHQMRLVSSKVAISA